ncbi:hypothetical protein ERT44_11580 [Stenotrophomonas sp. MA5]|jgi:hypothetical protein|uniref:hypothetical protein n=1 Tax=Stenotrophomonas sp. MA5 TaxID=2508572 RepID=UPI001009D738|nr:hypothetical protein [Stenotrophomonas sp. MA5]RXK66034.1 hypothetical protein ERT44_11580 [Stenotrophomonas sp. MA5]
MIQSKPVNRHSPIVLRPILLLSLLFPLAAFGQAPSQDAGQAAATRSAQAAMDAQIAADAHAAQGELPLAGDPDSTATLFDGLLDCQPKGWYLDAESSRPANPYLARHTPEPCERDEEFGIAYFCVNTDFHGLPVSRVVTHLGTAPTPIGILIDLPLDRARAHARRSLGSDFPDDARSQRGERPKLVPQGDNTQKSQLMGTPDWA